jgi:hypothetical protein
MRDVSELTWHQSRFRAGGIFADVGDGFGRYVVVGATLYYNGRPVGVFASVGEAKARARRGAAASRMMAATDDVSAVVAIAESFPEHRPSAIRRQRELTV